jgi:cytosine/adenosine deaminase-related metal-dependent hydrolase
VWLNQGDVELAAETGTCVCHNCSSNFRLRSGVAPLNAFDARGVNVAIGLDEAGINDDRDMLQEMRLVLRAHRVPGMDDQIPTSPQVLRMATSGGAATTPYKGTIGELVPGKAADLVAVDWRGVAYPYLDHEIPVVDAIVQRAKSSAVKFTMVEGEVIYEDGRFTRVDKAAALAELHRQFDRPDTPEEQAKRELGKAIFPHVKRWYEGYMEGRVHEPFYSPSSRV